MKIQAILFDMIGTTVQEKIPNTIRDCFRLAFEKHGVTPDNAVIRANRGKDKLVMINLILQQGNHPLTLALPIFESFQENINAKLDNFSAADNVPTLFQVLRDKGIKIGIGTGLPRAQADKIIEHLGWKKDNFQYIGISSELGKARPNPIMILDMMESLAITDKQTFLKVGDTLADLEEGKNGGVKTIGVLSGTQPKAVLEKGNPDFLINKIIEVVGIIDSFENDEI